MTDKQKQHKPEVLAPAGSINAFEKAIEAGADAVYIGAPALNARAVGRDFSLAEIAAMIHFAHAGGRKLYLAANSLLKESEIPQAMETLAILEELQPDALIIQDLGIYHLCRKYFKGLKLHASTLLGAHNSYAVRQFADMGFERVVLARELTIKEIGTIAKMSPVELEVFVHGALCFSYSGLCLFSSYLGGKSGLRGRCVQPCRRHYKWSKKKKTPGYLFSMNDLGSIDLVHKLAEAGISSFKIEGRLRSAHYVSSIVKAYRLAIDAPSGDKERLGQARQLLSQAMGRKTSQGYFSTPQAKQLISPHHSGNVGIYLGQAAHGSGKGKVTLTVKEAIETGDRLRLHQEGTGERVSFTLRNLLKNDRKVSRAAKGEKVILEVPASVKKGDSLFKVDSRAARQAEKEQPSIKPAAFNRQVKNLQHKLKQKLAGLHSRLTTADPRKQKPLSPAVVKRRRVRGGGKISLYVKTDDLQSLKLRLPFVPELFLVELNRKTFGDYQHKKTSTKKSKHKIVWCLPPVILENELEFFRNSIRVLLQHNFYNWQIAHIGQRLFFAGENRINLFGDYTLNILNSLALHALAAQHLQKVQVAIETDRKCLKNLAGNRASQKAGVDLGITLYGMVPLFTARPMADHFQYDQSFVSPKGESFTLHKSFNSTLALADKPFSLLPQAAELKRLGIQYGIVDLCHQKIDRNAINEISREMTGKGARRKLSSFNYFGELL